MPVTLLSRRSNPRPRVPTLRQRLFLRVVVHWARASSECPSKNTRTSFDHKRIPLVSVLSPKTTNVSPASEKHCAIPRFHSTLFVLDKKIISNGGGEGRGAIFPLGMKSFNYPQLGRAFRLQKETRCENENLAGSARRRARRHVRRGPRARLQRETSCFPPKHVDMSHSFWFHRISSFLIGDARSCF